MKQSKILKFIIASSFGLIKNEDQASYTLLALVFIAIFMSIFLVSNSGSNLESAYQGTFDPKSI